MATRALSVDSRENSTKITKHFKGDVSDKSQRRTLQTIQLSAVGENRLIGKASMKEENGKSKKKIKPIFEPVKIFEDEKLTEPNPANVEERGTQTSDCGDDDNDLAEADQEALELMSGEAAPEQYWKLLAEERRQALNDTLEENEQLHKTLDSLKEENEKLSEIATQAEYLSSFLSGVVSSEEDNDSVDDDDYKTGDEQLCGDDSDGSHDSEGSVYSPAASKLVKEIHAGTDSDSGSEDSVCSVSRRLGNKIGKDLSSKRFSGDWVNVELDEEKIASTEIIQAEALATVKEDASC